MLRAQRESLVLQRVRHLTEAEPILCALPVAVRNALPATSRVLPALTTLADLQLDHLGWADRARVQWLDATRQAIVAINAQLKELDARIPALLAELGCTLTDIVAIGVVTAMTLLTEIGDPTRFTTEAARASSPRTQAA